MALFKPEEAKALPLLTKVAQVNAENAREVATLALMECPDSEQIKEGAKLPGLTLFTRLQNTLRWIKAALDQVEQKQAIHPDLLERLEKDTLENQVMGVGIAHYVQANYQEGEYIPIQDLDFEQISIHTDDLSQLQNRILTEFWTQLQASQQRPVFARCPACCSVFILNPARRTHTYCSERCSRRVRATRNYREKRKFAEVSANYSPENA